MMSPLDSARLEKLRSETLQVLLDALQGERAVALLDVPNQRNVGDSLILEGEIEYLRAAGVRLHYVADLRSYSVSKLRAMMPKGVILLHGGGNFGDVWESHQTHRERIAQDLPDYRIVQLPQSVYFTSTQRARFANGILGAHPDFLLMIREKLSAERCHVLLPDVQTVFCPDMALGWRPPQARRAGDRLLVLARTDRESASALSTVEDGWISGVSTRKVDWHSTGALERRWRMARALTHIHRYYVRGQRLLPTRLDRTINKQYWRVLRALSRINIESGLALYDGVHVALVDRLHAHILASLIGIDHVLLDNSYGKLSSVYAGYTGDFTTAHYVQGLDQARVVAQQLLGR